MKNGVYRIRKGVLVTDVQSDLLNPTSTRVVVPLVPASDLKGGQPGPLPPLFEIEARR